MYFCLKYVCNMAWLIKSSLAHINFASVFVSEMSNSAEQFGYVCFQRYQHVLILV